MTKGTLQAHQETPAELLRVANSQQAEYHPTRATCRYTRASGWHANPPTKHLIERTRQRCTIQGTCAHPCAACVSQPQATLRLVLFASAPDLTFVMLRFLPTPLFALRGRVFPHLMPSRLAYFLLVRVLLAEQT